ncbi:MAG: S-adenosyl-L-methionine-dependent methyltransferase [Monoraphidium minutum]|nr:MAG: S-adenosyl-L-methionine-dependent methyltransferase [Monoraphidium minutum]
MQSATALAPRARCIAGARTRCRRAPHVVRVVAPDAAAPAAPATPAAARGSFHLACPICQTTTFDVPPPPAAYQRVACPRCQRTFEPAGASYLDLTLTSGAPQRVFKQRTPQATELFRQPLISFVYERGWRQNFAGAGFPGPEKEFEMAMRYLQPTLGGTLVDASCGTGLFTRLFARSGKFAGVVALDYSETMLDQAQAYFRDDPQLAAAGSTPIVCVRADIARLPFATGSVDAIHAGAAIHCWPNPQAALAEISRVLRPGGVFAASTFLTPFAPLGELVGDDAVRPIAQALNPFSGAGGTIRYWDEGELVDLVTAVGLTAYTRERSRMFVLFAATKPGGGA